MSKAETKKQLKRFYKGKTLTFNFNFYTNGEWVAECSEVPGLFTGGKNDTLQEMDLQIKDAILSAAQIDTQHVDILKLTVMPKLQSVKGKTKTSVKSPISVLSVATTV